MWEEMKSLISGLASTSHRARDPSGIFQSLFFQVSDPEQSNKSWHVYDLSSPQSGFCVAWGCYLHTWSIVISSLATLLGEVNHPWWSSMYFIWMQVISELIALEEKNTIIHVFLICVFILLDTVVTDLIVIFVFRGTQTVFCSSDCCMLLNVSPLLSWAFVPVMHWREVVLTVEH